MTSSTTAVSAPFPSCPGTLSAVRSSCARVRAASGIAVSASATDAFLRGISRSTFERLKQEHGVALIPLRFESTLAQVNFVAVLALLNTLSAYRAPLHAATGQGAYQNVVRLLLGLFLGDAEAGGLGKLSAAGLAGLTTDEVASIWNVSLFEERSAAGELGSKAGVIVGKRGGSMLEPVQLIVDLCRDTGSALQRMGYPDLGSFILESLRQARTAPPGDALDVFIDRLVRGVPGFADMHLVDGQEPCYLFKKAFFLVYALHARVPASQLATPDPAPLPMFVDNVIPTMLHAMRILDLSHADSEALREWPVPTTDQTASTAAAAVTPGPELSREDAYKVRASALDAGTHVVAAAHGLAAAEPAQFAWMADMTEVDLDGYLWAVAKDDKHLRSVPRLVERHTIMY